MFINPKVYKVILTGGPCSGKSSALLKLKKLLSENKNNVVFTVPEMATFVFDMCPDSWRTDKNFSIPVQFLINNCNMFFLGIVERLIKFSKYSCNFFKYDMKFIILFDRGLLDGEAWWNEDISYNTTIINTVNTKMFDPKECDPRCLILHYQTCAIDNPKHYTTENNKHRLETPEQAIECDNKIKEIYRPHKDAGKAYIISGKSLEDKIDKSLELINTYIEQ